MMLKSENVTLRPLSENDDLSDYLNFINDHEVTTYMGSGRFPQNIESLKKYIHTQHSSKNILLGIFVEEQHIGNITLQAIDWINRRGEIGIVIGKDFHGKSYGTETLKLIIDHAFNRLNLRKLICGVVESNVASKKLFERCGFVAEGVLKEHFYLNGKYENMLVMGLIHKKE